MKLMCPLTEASMQFSRCHPTFKASNMPRYEKDKTLRVRIKGTRSNYAIWSFVPNN